MSRQDLNYFERYGQSGENHLTRAALSFMRHVPLAQVEFLRLVDPTIATTTLPSVEFDFQTSRLHPEFEKRVRSGEIDVAEPEERLEVISTYLTPDLIERPIEVVESSRNPIYDGVLRFGDHLVVVVEAKLDEEIDPRQAQGINLQGLSGSCDLRSRGAHVRWHDLFEAWMRLDDRGMLGPAERSLLGDFFEMAEGEARFSGLLPFTTLRRAGHNTQRIDRRVRVLLEAATGLGAQADWAWYVTGDWLTLSRLYLWGDKSEGFHVGIWTGEQQREAKALYENPSTAHKLAALDGQRIGYATCSVTPRLGIAVRIPQLFVETTCRLDAGEFIDLWSSSLGRIHRYKADELEGLFEWMTMHALADDTLDRARFYETFVHPQRDQVDPRPALVATVNWDWEQAVALDNETGQLRRDVRQAADALLDALGEQPLAV